MIALTTERHRHLVILFDGNFSDKRKGEIHFHAARSVKDMFFIETARSSHFQHTLDLDHQEIERQQTGLTNTAA